MANIEKVIEKLESLGFIEVVLSTNEVFWQKDRVKVFLFEKALRIEYKSRINKDVDKVLINYDKQNILENLENIAQW